MGEGKESQGRWRTGSNKVSINIQNELRIIAGKRGNCSARSHRHNRGIGLDPAMYGTHTMRRTKASLIYRRTKNLRAVQLLLGHTKLESTVRYLGIEVDDALEMAEQTEV